MSVLCNTERTEMTIVCHCGCNEAYYFRIDKDKIGGEESYCFCSILSSNWYSDQNANLWTIWKKKLCKIWAILRNKDYYYSEVLMSKKDFEEFKQWVGEVK